MLTQLDLAVLVAICKATNASKSAHVPKPYFMKKFKNISKEAEKSLKKLISLGYVDVHPTSRETTFGLTVDGIELCRKLKESIKR